MNLGNLKDVVMIINNNDNRNKLMNFLMKFILCEICCKQVIFDYNNENNIPIKDIKLNMKTIKIAFYNASYSIDYDLLKKIFSSNDKKGKRSMKILRDKTMHEFKKNYIKEILNRYDELIDYMDLFLSNFELD